jgi:large subunit ribosomal protein L17
MLRNHIGTYGSHTRSLLKNQMRELVEHKSIVTTVTKAKVVQKAFEKLMTKAVKAAKAEKTESISLRRQINYYLSDRRLTNKLVDEIAKSIDKTSGFTRLVRIGRRRGDASEMVLLQIIEKQ